MGGLAGLSLEIRAPKGPVQPGPPGLYVESLSGWSRGHRVTEPLGGWGGGGQGLGAPHALLSPTPPNYFSWML